MEVPGLELPYMEVHMELSKKTTILFSPELHRRLAELAGRRRVSMGELVREACEIQYGVVDAEARRAAVLALAEMELPVGDPEAMKRESVPDPEKVFP
jgi:predicted transcriptional regulator